MNAPANDAAPPASKDRVVLGISCALLAWFLFSTMGALIKMKAADGFPIMQLVTIRCIGGLVAILPIILREGMKKSLSTNNVMGHFARSGIGVVAMGLTFTAMATLPLADATALLFTVPLLVTVWSVPLLKEKVGFHRWSAVLVGFVGVLLIAHPSGELTSVGIAIGLGAAVCQSFAMSFVRILNRTEEAAAIVFYFTISALVISGTLCLFWFGWKPIALHDVGILALLGLSGGLAQVFVTLAFRFAPAALISIFQYTNIVWATLYGFFLFGDLPGASVIGGTGIVIAAGAYIVWRETQLSRARKAVTVVKSGSPPL